MMYAATLPSDAPVPLQRLHGAARIGFTGASSALNELYQANPCRVLLPRRSQGRVEAVLLNTAGGITDGDRLDYGISAQDGAQVTATTQAAEKVYRSRGGDSHVRTRLTIRSGASLEWLPQETILFDGAALARKTDIDMDAGSRLLALDWLLLGRLASGERLSDAAVHDRWRLRQGGKLIWADDFRLKGDIEGLRQRPSLLGGARALATVIYAAADASRHLTLAQELSHACQGRSGVSERPGLLICRFLAADGLSLRRDVQAFLLALRTALHGRMLPLPRVWAC